MSKKEKPTPLLLYENFRHFTAKKEMMNNADQCMRTSWERRFTLSVWHTKMKLSIIKEKTVVK